MALQSLMLLVRAYIQERQLESADEHCFALQQLIPDDDRVKALAKEIRLYKRQLSEKAEAEKIEVQDIKAVAGFQSKINQIKKSLGKSPFIDRVNLLSRETMEPESLGSILGDFLFYGSCDPLGCDWSHPIWAPNRIANAKPAVSARFVFFVFRKGSTNVCCS